MERAKVAYTKQATTYDEQIRILRNRNEAMRLLYSKSPMLQPLIESQTGIILPVNTAQEVSFFQKIVNSIKKFF